MISICDVSSQQMCRELAVMFELEDHELPIVRIVYRMSDHSIDEIGQEQEFYKFALNKNNFTKEIAELKKDPSTHRKDYLLWSNRIRFVGNIQI